MELNKVETRVVADLLARELETYTDWYNNGLEEEYEFGRELLEVNHVLDSVEQELGEPVWDSEIYAEGRKMYKEDRIKLNKPIAVGFNECEVIFRFDKQADIQWMKYKFSFNRSWLEEIQQEDIVEVNGVVFNSTDKNVQLVLYKEDVEYLLGKLI